MTHSRDRVAVSSSFSQNSAALAGVRGSYIHAYDLRPYIRDPRVSGGPRADTQPPHVYHSHSRLACPTSRPLKYPSVLPPASPLEAARDPHSLDVRGLHQRVGKFVLSGLTLIESLTFVSSPPEFGILLGVRLLALSADPRLLTLPNIEKPRPHRRSARTTTALRSWARGLQVA